MRLGKPPGGFARTIQRRPRYAAILVAAAIVGTLAFPLASPAAQGGILSYDGGLYGVSGSNAVQTGVEVHPVVYLVIWGSQWGAESTDGNGVEHFSSGGDPADAASYVQRFMEGLGGNGETWDGVLTQYCQGLPVGATSGCSGAGSDQQVQYPYGGALAPDRVWYDNSSAAPASATGEQLAREATAAAAHFGNTTESSNLNAQYVILSPHGTNPDNYQNSGFCAWHDYSLHYTVGIGTSQGGVETPYGSLAFTNLPYASDLPLDAKGHQPCGANFVNGGAGGTQDGYSIVEGHEYAETVTDPLPNTAWNGAGGEIGDECAWIPPGSSGGAGDLSLATGSFAVQSLWSNRDGACASSDSISTGPPPDTTEADKFEPLLYFDSTEKWRPLNVDAFLTEKNPQNGQPWNQICATDAGCTGLVSAANLQEFPGPTFQTPNSYAYLSLHRNANSDPNSYTSPYYGTSNAPCSFPPPLLDCDSGAPSAIYFNVTPHSPGGYRYFNYWFFYRYNQANQDQGNHAGDWEGMTVAPSRDGTTFQFAEFSQHGTWYSYLRDGLECDNGPVGSCGTEGPPKRYSGLHVMTFPAAGSHADYPQPNMTSNPSVYSSLYQSEPPGSPPDNGNNGQAGWGENLVPSALLPVPAASDVRTCWICGPMNWTDWPGHWGETRKQGLPFGFTVPFSADSPISPAAPQSGDHGPHFFAPWNQPAHPGINNLSCLQFAACPSSARSHQPTGCGDWMGGGVVALVCQQANMQSALRRGQLDRPGAITVELPEQHRFAATAPGLSQALGHPLHVGERAVLRGTVSAGAVVLLVAARGRRIIVAMLRCQRPVVGRAILLVVAGAHGFPAVVLKYGHQVQRVPTIDEQTVPISRNGATHP